SHLARTEHVASRPHRRLLGARQSRRARARPLRAARPRPGTALCLDRLLRSPRARQHREQDVRALERLRAALLPGGTLVLDNEESPFAWRVRRDWARAPRARSRCNTASMLSTTPIVAYT